MSEYERGYRDAMRRKGKSVASHLYHIADLKTRITALESALRDCMTHMKTAGSPKAIRAAEAAERLLSYA